MQTPQTQRSRVALPVILTGTFMVVLDFFIVNVALPSMRGGLHASATALQWVVAGYSLTSAVLLMASGRLGGRFGRRRVFAAGLGLFTASSAACGIAPSAGFLVAARLVQGVAAALLMPNVLALITILCPGPERARALSAYGMVMGLAAAGGQLLGGALVQSDLAGLGWRTVFLINVPVGLGALALVGRSVPESRDPDARAVDLPGTALVTAALTALVLPLIEGRQLHWPAWCIASLAATPPLAVTLLAHLRRRTAAGRPVLIDLSLFGRRGVPAGLAAQGLFWCGQASFFLVLALYLQSGRGLSALDAGLVFTILAVAYLGASAFAPPLTVRHGRRVLAVGAATLAAGHLALITAVAAVGTAGSIIALVPGLLLVGAGMGLGITPLATIVLGAAGPQAAGPASDLLATVQNIGNALGVAIVGIVFFGRVGHGYAGAFGASEAVLAAVLTGVIVLARLLPGSERSVEAPLGAEVAA